MDKVVGSMDHNIDSINATAVVTTSTAIGGLKAEFRTSMGEFQRNGAQQLQGMESELRTLITEAHGQAHALFV